MDEFGRIIDSFVDWIPNLIGAIFILIIGWIIALILKSVVKSLLENTGLNRKMEESPADSFVRKLTDNPALTIGSIVYWLVIIVTVTIVIGALEIPVLTDLVNRIYGYVPNLIAAIFILLLALSFSGLVSSMLIRWMGDTPTGRIASTVIPVIILSIAGFAILEQLGIAPVIISTTYIALIGAFSLAFALAFGLGGRDVAAKILEQAYDRGARGMSQVRRDVHVGAERATQDAQRIKSKYQKR